jgi:hypothetical protein
MLLHYGSSANTVAIGGWTPLQVLLLEDCAIFEVNGLWGRLLVKTGIWKL